MSTVKIDSRQLRIDYYERKIKIMQATEEVLSDRAIAKRIGVNISTMTEIINGNRENPTIESFAKLCAWIGKPIDKYIKVTL